MSGQETCIHRHDAMPVGLPSGYRLVLQLPDEEKLQLVDPRDGSMTPIPGTQGTRFILPLENGQQMLLFHVSGDDRTWQVMNFDGTETYFALRYGADYRWHSVNEYADNTLGIWSYQFLDEGIAPVMTIIHLDNGKMDGMATPNMPDRLDRSGWHFDRRFERVAYWYRANGENRLRVHTIETGESVDIETRGLGAVNWSRDNTSIAWTDIFTGDVVIYDSHSGELLYAIEPHPATSLFTGRVNGGTPVWSPDGGLVAIAPLSEIDDDRVVQVALYDLQNNQWLDTCFWVDNPGWYDDSKRADYFWSPDGRFLWWLEPGANLREEMGSSLITRRLYGWDLVAADVETGAYGVVATDVGWFSSLVLTEDDQASR